MAKLGKQQLRLLSGLANPSMALVVGDPIARSLHKRGLLNAVGKNADSFFTITPHGMRAVADALERGDIRGFSPDDIKPRARSEGGNKP